MNIRTTILCLPVQNLEETLTFYSNIFGLPDIKIEEGMITIELPNLSLFFMETTAFEGYSRKAGRGVQLPNQNVGTIISCALMTKKDVDTALENAPNYGGVVKEKAKIDELYGGYIGYISDPDGHLWELVYPQQN
ncbi:VOC family protein [Leeuwenhoekiella parthenopeia]|uniref:VOC family protein n=1 Tax=Leeuwenhoekiella parthenopeia TaxID=2890320 RepID=A0ABS8GUA1_9FLAO|nr:VOC family protein [Leeuwenhoekiella parthenopeia]MCC4213591.1 VOC family protein [Leeuwenhoekiella parthenopeia]